MTDVDFDNELDTASDKVPAERQAGGGNLGRLKDGEHTFTVVSGELKRLPAYTQYVLKVAVVTDDGQTYTGEKTYWLKGKNGVDERQINNLKADLATLGFDVPQWTQANGKSFTGQLVRITGVMPGLMFKGKKSTGANKTDPSKPYLNIYVNERADDGKPKTLDEAAVAALDKTNDVPF